MKISCIAIGTKNGARAAILARILLTRSLRIAQIKPDDPRYPRSKGAATYLPCGAELRQWRSNLHEYARRGSVV